jgi:hypothetical protein
MRAMLGCLVLGIAGNLLYSPSLAHATPIQNLPGLIGISICFVLSPTSTECDGLRRSALAANPDALIPIASPGTHGILAGGLSDANGELGRGDEFFVLSFTSTSTSRFLLDSISLYFDSNEPVYQEFPSAITATAGLTFRGGFGQSDLIRALGPPDGKYVEIMDGYLVLGFTSSTPAPPPPPPPTPVPEASTLLLLGSGLAGLAGVAWRRHRK